MKGFSRTRSLSFLLVLVGLTAAACGAPAPAPPPDDPAGQSSDDPAGQSSDVPRYQLTGQVLEINLETNQVLIRHDDIEDVMPAMTMPFLVLDRALLDPLSPGDLVTATLVFGNLTYLSAITRTGSAPLPDDAVPPGAGDAGPSTPPTGQGRSKA